MSSWFNVEESSLSTQAIVQSKFGFQSFSNERKKREIMENAAELCIEKLRMEMALNKSITSFHLCIQSKLKRARDRIE